MAQRLLLLWFVVGLVVPSVSASPKSPATGFPSTGFPSTGFPSSAIPAPTLGVSGGVGAIGGFPSSALPPLTFGSFESLFGPVMGAGSSGDSSGKEYEGEPRDRGENPEPRHFEPAWSRWYAPGNPKGGIEPPPYFEVNEKAHPLNPYRQNILKGDFPIKDPIFGWDDLFFTLTVTNRTLTQFRKLPTPSGLTGPRAFNENFFGRGKQRFFSDDLAISFDLFRGQQAFRPVKFRLKVTPVFNWTQVKIREVGALRIDISEGRTREDAHAALQEAIFELHLHDWNDRYDFISVEGGIIPFRSDFRGFIFDDSNLGVRFLGNADDNKWQYNLLYFDMLDKDTNSLLNNFDNRQQQVWIANVYRQDWPMKGYISQLSFHYNNDHRDTHFDDNGRLVSPAPAGSADEHDISAYYLGWAGEGHIGRIGITHALYQVYGKDSKNPFAGRRTRIDAQFAALELSYDIDWIRYRLFGMYASGDNNARDSEAGGFDAILDAPNFAGGEASFFNSQAIGLLGVNLTNLFSPLVDFQTNKFEGQSNFVNPGLILVGAAIDYELMPTLRGQLGGSYLRFDEDDPLEVYLELPEVEKEIGIEFFTSLSWRPLLTNNIVINVGASALIPGDGLERIYQSGETLYSVFINTILTW